MIGIKTFLLEPQGSPESDCSQVFGSQQSEIHGMEARSGGIRFVSRNMQPRRCYRAFGAIAVVMAGLAISALSSYGQAGGLPGTAIMPGGASSGMSASGGVAAGVTDEPIFPGEVVNINVFDAPDFSTTARVSKGGDIALPYLGIVHVADLNSASAASLIEKLLLSNQLIVNPHVTVTVDATSTGITVLGEVKTPGIYSPSGKHRLSDVLAMAGGMTANVGRIIEISTGPAPDQKALLPWDPTMHNTSLYDRVIPAGSRIVVKPCGVAYVGGNVGRPGAYPICASRIITVSQLVAMASGEQTSSYQSHTILVRTHPDGTRTVQQIDINKVLKAKAPDPVVQADDIIYIPLSGVKYTLRSLPGYIASFGTATLNVYGNR